MEREAAGSAALVAALPVVRLAAQVAAAAGLELEIYKCINKRDVAHRSEPNQTSTRTHGVAVGDTREAVALVDGVNADGVTMKWKGGGHSCFVDPS